MVSVVIDTNILVAGLRSRQGASFQILRKIGLGEISGIISVPLLLEYEDVLKRSDNLEAFSLTTDDIDVVLNMVCQQFAHIVTYYLWRPLLRDPKDDMILELTIAGEASAILTHNIADFDACKRYFRHIQIITPKDFLNNERSRS